jgi:hypothetical protein
MNLINVVRHLRTCDAEHATNGWHPKIAGSQRRDTFFTHGATETGKTIRWVAKNVGGKGVN